MSCCRCCSRFFFLFLSNQTVMMWGFMKWFNYQIQRMIKLDNIGQLSHMEVPRLKRSIGRQNNCSTFAIILFVWIYVVLIHSFTIWLLIHSFDHYMFVVVDRSVGRSFGWSVTHSLKTSKSSIFSTEKWFWPSKRSIHLVIHSLNH